MFLSYCGAVVDLFNLALHTWINEKDCLKYLFIFIFVNVLENDRISFIPPSSKRAKETASPPVDMYTDRLQPYQTSRPGASFSLLGPREQPRQTSGPRGREQNSQIRHFLSYPGLSVNKNEISLFKVYD